MQWRATSWLRHKSLEDTVHKLDNYGYIISTAISTYNEIKGVGIGGKISCVNCSVS